MSSHFGNPHLDAGSSPGRGANTRANLQRIGTYFAMPCIRCVSHNARYSSISACKRAEPGLVCPRGHAPSVLRRVRIEACGLSQLARASAVDTSSSLDGRRRCRLRSRVWSYTRKQFDITGNIHDPPFTPVTFGRNLRSPSTGIVDHLQRNTQ